MAQLPPGGPCAFVIFGASGDLTMRLLIPALYHLKRANLLPEEFALVGVSRKEESDEQFRDRLGKSLRELSKDIIEESDWKWLAERMYYMAGSTDDPATYQRLKALLQKTDADHHTGGNYLFYMAVPSAEFSTIAQQLGAARLGEEANGQWRRVVVEKPFGTDLDSAKALNRVLLGVFAETQIYRIDHYLGKETVQNIMVLRFGNGLFEPIWNRHHIDHVEITVAEALGVEARGQYYDATGALRDMVPNHIFQLLTLTAMEPPTCFEANATRNEKGKVLDAIRNFSHQTAYENVVRAQYGRGTIQGRDFPAYRKEPNVDPNSVTETYVAMKLTVDNWRWAGVPFYLRTGKALATKRSEIVIQFKQAPLTLFQGTPVECLTSNDLALNIQPEEGVSLRFGAKVPGPAMRIGDVEMRFNYGDYFHVAPNNGYETLLYDCMMGDASLFQRADTIEAGWGIIQPVLDFWAEERVNALPQYPAGSEGPAEADALIERDGRKWRPVAPRAGRA
ncbi:MAG TPA: glucose-6-phosphate dehydrogenase [Micropepsaceae bacterium]|nr:glucose-6-phosphate dehydrogenase [Micropepsaceae bacterium]